MTKCGKMSVLGDVCDREFGHDDDHRQDYPPPGCGWTDRSCVPSEHDRCEARARFMVFNEHHDTLSGNELVAAVANLLRLERVQARREALFVASVVIPARLSGAHCGPMATAYRPPLDDYKAKLVGEEIRKLAEEQK